MMHMLVVVVGIYHCGVVARNALLRTLDEVKQFENELFLSMLVSVSINAQQKQRSTLLRFSLALDDLFG